MFPRLSAIIRRFFLDAEDGIMQYDLGAELNRECLEPRSYGYVGKSSVLPTVGVQSSC